MTVESVSVDLSDDEIARIDTLATASRVTREAEILALLRCGLAAAESEGRRAPPPSTAEPS